MRDLFNQSILVSTPSQSNFPFDFKKKFSARAGVCIPHFVQDVIPGDYIKMGNTLFCRTMPLVAPMFQDFKISQHFFFVPKRLLWRNFEKYYTGGADGTSQSSIIDDGHGGYTIKNPELVMPWFTPSDGYYMSYKAQGEPKVPFAHNYDVEPGSSDYDNLTPHQKDVNTAFAFNGSLLDYLRLPKSYCKFSTHDVEGVKKPYWTITNGALYESSQPIPYWYLDCYHLIMKQYYKDENIKLTEDDDSGLWTENSEINCLGWYNDINNNFGLHYEGPYSYGYQAAGDLPAGYFALFRRAWRKDYFTSLLPWAQRGEQAVMPMMSAEDNIVPVSVGSTTNKMHPDNVGAPNFGTITIDGVSVPYGNAHIAQDPADPTKLVLAYGTASGEKVVKHIDFNNTAGVDLSSVQLFSIRELRRTEALQRFLEKMARGGARFSEQIMSIFGVKTADARLNIPEYLGGCTQILQVDSVEQNSQTTDDSALGTLAGKGKSAGTGYIFDYNVTEPGIIMGICSIMPRASYQQGLHRDVQRGLVRDPDLDIVVSDRFEEIWPDFARIGEQAVYNKEIFFGENSGTSEDENDGLLGYQMRYAEAKCRFDEINGQFAQQLDYWHAGRIFESQPHLNQDFIQCHPTNRIFANTDDNAENFLVECDFDILMSRPLPFFGEPKLVG